MKRLAIALASVAVTLVGRAAPCPPQPLLQGVSPYAPAQIVPASEKAAVSPSEAALRADRKDPRRARPPHSRRKEGAIPGLVTIPFGKTASGERTHLYRVMGQGGCVLDFTDYGARLVRAYAPDETGALADVVAGAPTSVLGYEKAGDLSAVWKMTPIRRPRATGVVFELDDGTNGTAKSVGRVAARQPDSPDGRAVSMKPPQARVMYLLDANNLLSIESMIADTNAVRFVSDIRLAPFANRPLSVKTPETTLSFATTTNIMTISTRPLTNATQRTEFHFTGIKKL